jgi:cell division protein FtsB
VLSQRLIPALLIAMLVALQAQLWIGRGSVPHVNQLRNKLQELDAKNKTAQSSNDQLASEVRDLKEGLEMVEERARAELGMVKPNEILVQYSR